MSPIYRAAMAASAALILSACASVKTTETSMSETSSDKSKAEAEKMIDTIPSPVPVMAETEMATETVMTETSQASTETLLYGAMTKWELQSFVEVVQGADLSGALEANGPMTVFAPNNDAFGYAKIGADADVPAILKGHIVPGALDAKALMAAVAENGAPVALTSISGAKLTVYVMDGKVKVAGPGGTLATVTQADMIQSNGVMHQISSVLMP